MSRGTTSRAECPRAASQRAAGRPRAPRRRGSGNGCGPRARGAGSSQSQRRENLLLEHLLDGLAPIRLQEVLRAGCVIVVVDLKTGLQGKAQRLRRDGGNDQAAVELDGE